MYLDPHTQTLIIPADENTSAEAKQHAREVLSAAGYQVEKSPGSTDEHEIRVMAGYKAALASRWFSMRRCRLPSLTIALI
jgi:hypothetical protein